MLQIESVLGPEMALALQPPSERLSAHPPSFPVPSTTSTSGSGGGGALPAGLDPSRFIYYNRVNNSFLTSHPAFCLKGLPVCHLLPRKRTERLALPEPILDKSFRVRF